MKLAVLTIKGRALLAAIDAGLLPETPDGWDDEPFERFWSLFCKELGYDPDARGTESPEETTNPFEDGSKMLDKERPQDGHKGGQENKPDLKAVLGLLIGGVLGTFFTALGFALFVL